MCISHPLPHHPGEAFATKHLPPPNHDVKEFQVFHWKLRDWKELERKLTSPEFDCGGYKWCILPGYRRVCHSHRLTMYPGRYISSPVGDLAFHQMTVFLSISIAPAPRLWKRVGTLAPNLRWPSQTFTIPQSIPSVVRNSQFQTSSLNL